MIDLLLARANISATHKVSHTDRCIHANTNVPSDGCVMRHITYGKKHTRTVKCVHYTNAADVRRLAHMLKYAGTT